MYVVFNDIRPIEISGSLKSPDHRQFIKYIGFAKKDNGEIQIIGYVPDFRYCFPLNQREYELLVFNKDLRIKNKIPCISLVTSYEVFINTFK